jgi:hypothetical protein
MLISLNLLAYASYIQSASSFTSFCSTSIYIILCHFTDLQHILIIIVLMIIEDKTKLLAKSQKYNGSITKLHQLLIEIHDLVESINEYFKPCLVQTVAFLYCGTIINFYWLGLFLIGSDKATLLESVFYIIQNVVTIFCLGFYDSKIKRNLSEAVFKVIATQTGSEDILTFVVKKPVQIGAFRLVYFDFRTIAKV